MIDRAEQYLRGLGISVLRVRYHRGDLARIEVPLEEIARLAEPNVRQHLLTEFQAIGFRYVTLDLAGHRSGSMNDVLPLDALVKTVR